MPPAPRDAGPVIGGSLAISAAPPAPPPPNAKGPGAGNASGLVLMLVVAVGVVFAIVQKWMNSRPSAAQLKAQKMAQKMAADLRNAAQQEKSTPKSKEKKATRSPGRSTKGSDARFTRLTTEEDAADDDVEACGEEDEDEMEYAMTASELSTKEAEKRRN